MTQFLRFTNKLRLNYTIEKIVGLLFVVSAMCSACMISEDEKIYEPVRVSIADLRWHADSLPRRILEVRGYYSNHSNTGTPHIYSDEFAAKMLNDADAFPVSLVEQNIVSAQGCDDGYVKSYGYLESENQFLRTFVMVPYDDDWNEAPPCWSTDLDWQNDPEYTYLLPGSL